MAERLGGLAGGETTQCMQAVLGAVYCVMGTYYFDILMFFR
jgi:hypothetical protein